jgi:hypothetical protein
MVNYSPPEGSPGEYKFIKVFKTKLSGVEGDVMVFADTATVYDVGRNFAIQVGGELLSEALTDKDGSVWTTSAIVWSVRGLLPSTNSEVVLQ